MFRRKRLSEFEEETAKALDIYGKFVRHSTKLEQLLEQLSADSLDKESKIKILDENFRTTEHHTRTIQYLDLCLRKIHPRVLSKVDIGERKKVVEYVKKYNAYKLIEAQMEGWKHAGVLDPETFPEYGECGFQRNFQKLSDGTIEKGGSSYILAPFWW